CACAIAATRRSASGFWSPPSMRYSSRRAGRAYSWNNRYSASGATRTRPLLISALIGIRPEACTDNSCSAWSPRDNIDSNRRLHRGSVRLPSLGSFWLDPLERAFHRLVRGPRARPTVQPTVHDPDHQKTEYAGKHPIREEMRAGCHAQDPDGGAEGERSRISERAPVRRHHRGSS